MDLPISLGASLGESFEETFVIGIVEEDRLATVTPVHHMINRSGIFDAQGAGHDASSSATRKLCQYLGLTPLRNFPMIR